MIKFQVLNGAAVQQACIHCFCSQSKATTGILGMRLLVLWRHPLRAALQSTPILRSERVLDLQANSKTALHFPRRLPFSSQGCGEAPAGPDSGRTPRIRRDEWRQSAQEPRVFPWDRLGQSQHFRFTAFGVT